MAIAHALPVAPLQMVVSVSLDIVQGSDIIPMCGNCQHAPRGREREEKTLSKIVWHTGPIEAATDWTSAAWRTKLALAVCISTPLEAL